MFEDFQNEYCNSIQVMRSFLNKLQVVLREKSKIEKNGIEQNGIARLTRVKWHNQIRLDQGSIRQKISACTSQGRLSIILKNICCIDIYIYQLYIYVTHIYCVTLYTYVIMQICTNTHICVWEGGYVLGHNLKCLMVPDLDNLC